MNLSTIRAARREAYRLPLRLTTWNAGRGTIGDLADLMAVSDVIAVQEFSDRRHDLAAFAIEHGWQLVDGEGEPGQAATALLVSPHVKILRTVALPMIGKSYIGPGKGPDHNKPKFAVGALMRKGPVIFGVVSTHLVASQGRRLRRLAAVEHVRHLRERFTDRHFPWFVLGDFNATPTSDVLRPLYRSGWTNTHKERRALRTHGLRPIDYLWWKSSRRVELLTVHTLRTRSDHRALRALFLVGVTPHR